MAIATLVAVARFPASAGIDPPPFPSRLLNGGFPRKRGDRPSGFHGLSLLLPVPPQARG